MVPAQLGKVRPLPWKPTGAIATDEFKLRHYLQMPRLALCTSRRLSVSRSTLRRHISGWRCRTARSASGMSDENMMRPPPSKEIRCASNAASRCAASNRPLCTSSRSASLLHSAQGMMWLARSSRGWLTPVTAQARSQNSIKRLAEHVLADAFLAEPFDLGHCRGFGQT